jgi:uncharacterized protein (TIGR02466 family)
MKAMKLFPTPIGIDSIDKTLCRNAKDNIDNMILMGDIISDNTGLCFSTPDNLDQRSEFYELYQTITNKVNVYATTVLRLKENILECSGMWANMHSNKSKHHYHQHANSYISGVVFLEIPECDAPGEFIFVDPRPAKTATYGDYNEDAEISNNTYFITPKVGACLLFPSWLAHGTNSFICNTNEKRYSLSFNYRLTLCSQPTMRIRRS